MQQFQRFILNWYQQYGRTHLPWRQTTDPYRILVSELMLQQTQVERVIPKYLNFLEHFPTVEALSKSPLSSVLIQWQGLGYNRRAKFLHQTAQAVVTEYKSLFPTSTKELLTLPGIGPYTASAVTVFAYNQPMVVIETNIRAVFLYHFFPGKEKVPDAELLLQIEQALYHQDPRLWYSALMDYGSKLKQLFPNPTRQSKQYTRQSTFQGSLRQSRGEIIRILAKHRELSEKELLTMLSSNHKHHQRALEDLISEQLVLKKEKSVRLA